MRVCIVAIGSTGDVVPYLGVAEQLTAAGWQVTVATHDRFASWVREVGASHSPLPMDPEAELTEAKAHEMRRGPLRAARVIERTFEPYVRDIAWAIDGAAQSADVMMLSAMAWFGTQSAEGLGIPSCGLHLQPLEPTREFAPPALSTRSLGGSMNLVMGRAVQRRMAKPYMAVVNEVRRSYGLPRTSTRGHLDRLRAVDWPVLVGVDQYLVPRPHDWRAGVRVTGAWRPPSLRDWAPTAALTAFLSDGPKPVYVGFGSTRPARAGHLEGLVRDAARNAGVRLVVASGWSGMELEPSDRIFVSDSVDHAWLFSRVAAAVHHAGAGTSAAALRAGVVSIPVPLGLDQPFWASRLRAANAATEPIAARSLTAERLAAALVEATTSVTLGEGSRRASRAVQRQDGLSAVTSTLHTLVPQR